jgi:phage baseplate assembly protein W
MATTRALSIEDKQLGTVSLITSADRAYKDIDLTFERKGGTNDVYKKTDAAAVKQAVKNLISTNHFEKPFVPNYGGNIRAMLFELADDNSAVEIERNIRNTIYQYEPRAEVVSIESIVEPDRNNVRVTLTFKVVSTQQLITFTTVINRLR